MTFLHLTSDPGFRLDPDRVVIGYGPKGCAPCEAMTGVLYVTTDVGHWADVRGYGDWNERTLVAAIEIDESAVEGVDYVTLSDRETLITNLAVARVTDLTPLP